MRWDDAEQPGRLTVVLPSTECRIDLIYLFEYFFDVFNSDRGLGPCEFWLVQLLAVRDLDLLVYVVYIHMNSLATMVVLMRQMNLHVHAE